MIGMLSVWVIHQLAFLQDVPLPDWTNLVEVLTWLTTEGGAVIAAGVVIAFLAENFPWWHKLPSWAKTVIPMSLSVAIAFGSMALLQVPFVASLSPIYRVVVLIVLAWLSSQVAYIYAKSRGYGARAKAK